MSTTQLRQTGPHTFEDVAGGREPGFLRCRDGGEIQYWHETGYGYLPEDRVEIVPATTSEGGR